MKIEKGFREEARPRKGVMKEKLPHNRNLSQMCQWELWNLRGHITRKTQNKTKQKTHRICILTATASAGAAQMLQAARSKWGRDREAWAASSVLRVKTKLECPDNNMRGLNVT